ncbi:hypothetical protein [Fischerella sp. FACHB-380]|nr:hypothetical protein [Fischerella sp. FACHB-380]
MKKPDNDLQTINLNTELSKLTDTVLQDAQRVFNKFPMSSMRFLLLGSVAIVSLGGCSLPVNMPGNQTPNSQAQNPTSAPAPAPPPILQSS